MKDIIFRRSAVAPCLKRFLRDDIAVTARETGHPVHIFFVEPCQILKRNLFKFGNGRDPEFLLDKFRKRPGLFYIRNKIRGTALRDNVVEQFRADLLFDILDLRTD